MRRAPFLSTVLSSCLLALSACGDEPPAPVNPEPEPGTPSDRPRPVLTASSIPEGAQDVYPLELYFDHEASRPGIYSRKQLSLRFSVPMRTANAQLTLQNHTDPSSTPRIVTGKWSEDGRELLLTLPAPEDGGPGGAALEEKSRYTLDLSALRGAEVGNQLDSAAFLGDGRLDFTTAARDGGLEHACTHALANDAEAIQATTGEAPPFGFAPLTDTGHSRYRVTLPGEQQHGYTSLVSKPDQDEHIVFYLDRELAVSAYDGMESKDVAVKVEAARPVCAGITHVASFTAAQGDRDYFLRFGPTPGAVFEFILERHAH